MKKELCHHCGASMMMNCAALSMHALRCLAKAAQHSEPFQTKDLRLTKTEYPNVTKLKYWGFIRRVGKKHWQITDDGLDFLRGKTMQPSKIWYFRDKIVRTDGFINVWDIVEEQESREKYIELMRPVLGEFQTKLSFF